MIESDKCSYSEWPTYKWRIREKCLFPLPIPNLGSNWDDSIVLHKVLTIFSCSDPHPQIWLVGLRDDARCDFLMSNQLDSIVSRLQGGQQSSPKKRWKSNLSTIKKVTKKWPILDYPNGTNNNYNSNSLITGIEKSSSYLNETEFWEETYSASFTSPFSMESLLPFEKFLTTWIPTGLFTSASWALFSFQLLHQTIWVMRFQKFKSDVLHEKKP